MSARKKIDQAARKINKLTGATNLAKYLGESMAKRKNPAVKRTVSGKDALKSASKVALSIATVAGVGGVAKLATKAKGAKTYVQQSSNAYLKRTYSGHEREGFRQAAKRNANKKRRK